MHSATEVAYKACSGIQMNCTFTFTSSTLTNIIIIIIIINGKFQSRELQEDNSKVHAVKSVVRELIPFTVL